MTRRTLSALMAAVLLMAVMGLWLGATNAQPLTNSGSPTATLPPVDDGTPAAPPIIIEPPDYVYPYPYPDPYPSMPETHLPIITGYPAAGYPEAVP